MEDIHDIKGLVPLPHGWWWVWLVLALVVAAVALWLWKRKGPNAPAVVVPPPTPYEVAIRELRRLREENPPVEEFYTRLSDIVRRYLEGQMGLRAPERTTEEFLIEVSRDHSLSAEHRELLGAFLQEADLVKFARFQPGAEDMQRALDAAEKFVHDSQPRIEEAVRDGMKFASPWSLALLLVLPVWLWWERRTAQRGGLKYSSVTLALSVSSFWAALGPLLLLLLRGAALALFIVALARPQLGRSESKIKTEGIDIVLVIDISGSMWARDYEKGGRPESRIDAVKDVVREFIRERPNDRIGMVVFGTHAYVASPLTLDHDWIEHNLDRVRVGLVEGNTAIGAGIGTGVNRLRDTKAKSKVIVLLTDGGENVKSPPALDAAKAAKEFNVRVYTVGAGSDYKGPIQVVDDNGKFRGMIQADLDEDLLKQVAATTGGQYFRAADTASLKKTYAQIDAMEKQKIETVAYEDWQELFPWFLTPGLGCLVLAVTLEHTRLRRLP